MRALKADKSDRVMDSGTPRKKVKPETKERAVPRRNRRRRLLVSLVAVLAFGLAGAGVYGYSQNWHGQALTATDKALDDGWRAVGLQVREVTITGRKRTGPDALRRAAAVQIGDPILRLDLTEIQQRIEAVGWVRHATVTRHLPDRLHIEIEERAPFARWQLNGRTALIDDEGQVIARNVGARFSHLPGLVGQGANDRAAALFDLLQGAPRLARQVKTANLVRERRWDIGMDNGVMIRLPEPDAADAWTRFADMDKRDSLLAQDFRLIDLRVPGRVIVGAKPKAPKTHIERET